MSFGNAIFYTSTNNLITNHITIQPLQCDNSETNLHFSNQRPAFAGFDWLLKVFLAIKKRLAFFRIILHFIDRLVFCCIFM